MNIDSHFIIGKSHKVCQDYAMHGISNSGKPYIMIADGLSRLRLSNGKVIPHPTSDISSRLVCLAAMKTINTVELTFGLELEKITKNFSLLFPIILTKMSEEIYLDNLAMDSTLRLAISSQGGVAIISVGDGVTILETESRYIYNYSTYEPNMPINCSYLISDSRRKSYLSEEVKEREHTLISFKNEKRNSLTNDMFTKDPEFIKASIHPIDVLKSITLTSDGIEQIARGNKFISVSEAHTHILPFKNTKGEFVKRRMNGIILSLKQNNLTNEDDISMASIIF